MKNDSRHTDYVIYAGHITIIESSLVNIEASDAIIENYGISAFYFTIVNSSIINVRTGDAKTSYGINAVVLQLLVLRSTISSLVMVEAASVLQSAAAKFI